MNLSIDRGRIRFGTIYRALWNIDGAFVRMDGARANFRVKVDTAAGKLLAHAVPRPGSSEKLSPPATRRYTRAAPSGAIELAGRYDGRELIVRGERVDESKFLLSNRGFRWVDEYLFNR